MFGPFEIEIGEAMRTLSRLCVLAAVSGFAASAIATPLPLGSSNVAPSAWSGSNGGNNLASYTIAGTLTSGFSANNGPNTISGDLRSLVLEHNVTGNLTFVYQIVQDISATQRLARVSEFGGDWGLFSIGFFTELGQNYGNLGAGSNAFGASNAAEHLAAQQIAFTFPAGHVVGGETSHWVIFETTAKNYRRGFASVQDGNVSQSNIGMLVPALIPLPSAGLMGLAGMGLVAVRRRR